MIEPERTGGDLLAETLKCAGVEKVFALHGGHLEAFYKGCLNQEIELIDFRHEAAAVHAADGYARATGGLGVCAVTAGPGFANALSAVVNANLDASPVLVLVGAPPLREAETNPLQGGFDQIAMATPGVKWAHRITNTERMPDLTAMAIRRATTGRRGAVLLELPIDVLHMPADPRIVTTPAGLSVHPRPAPGRDEARRLVELLAAAERPAIIVGGDARFSQCGPELKAFVERSGVPVFSNTKGLGLLPTDHPIFGGSPSALAVLGLIGAPPPDAVLVLGARLGLLLAGRSGSIIPHAAKLGQVYPDAGELGRIRDVDVAVVADCDEALRAMSAAAADTVWGDLSGWRNSLATVKQVRATAYPQKQAAGGVHPWHACKAALDVSGPDAAYAFDGGEAASWASDVVEVNGPGRVLTHGYLGCLGIGPGFAIGLQEAFPDRRVVQVTGDGALGFHLMEFDTMVRRKLPIVTVVINNQVWGMSIHGQQIMYGANYSAITRLGETRYADIARAFGCHGERVDRYEDVAPAMRRALDCGTTACLEIMVDAGAVHPSTVAMLGKPADGSDDIIIPYYENLPGAGVKMAILA
jgi:acetolactate synthase-1/2/3 large subunit